MAIYFCSHNLHTRPFYNSWKVATSENLSEEDNNSAFHFESWNFGHEDSNSSED
jgi:hypothetical protein